MAVIVMNTPINSADTPEMIPFLQPNRINRMIPPENKSSSKVVLPPTIGILLANPGTGNERALMTKYLSAVIMICDWVIAANIDLAAEGTTKAEIRIDFGNVFYYFDELSKEKNNKLAEAHVIFSNNSSDRFFTILANYHLIIEHTDQRNTVADFPIEIKISDANSGAIWDSDIRIYPKESKRLLFQLFGPSSYSKHNYMDKDATTSTIMSVKIRCAATLCTSVLFIENNELQTRWSEQESGYEKSEIQVWNRSECSLHYRIEDVVDEHDTEQNWCKLSYSPCSGSQNSSGKSGNDFIVPPFASQRIVIATTVEKKDFTGGSRTIKVQNMRNPSNFYCIKLCMAARFRSMQEDQLTKAGDNGASVENPTDEWDSINLYSKGVPRDLNLGLNFGDCYIGLEKTKTVYLTNSNAVSVDVNFRVVLDGATQQEVTISCPNTASSQTVSYYSSEASDSDTNFSSKIRSRLPVENSLSSKKESNVIKSTGPSALSLPVKTVQVGSLTPHVSADMAKEFAYLNSFGWKLSATAMDLQRDVSGNTSVGSKVGDSKKKSSASKIESLSAIFSRMWCSDYSLSCLIENDPINEVSGDQTSVAGKFGGMASITLHHPRPFLTEVLSAKHVQEICSTKRTESVLAKSETIVPYGAQKQVSVVACSFTMSPGQRRFPVIFKLKPLDQRSTAELLNGVLNSRSIAVHLEWKSSVQLKGKYLYFKSYLDDRKIALHVNFRSCLPIISVSPLQIDLGNCQRNTQRDVSITINNCSDLLAEICLTDSADSRLHFIAEHTVAPRNSITVPITFDARTKSGQYNSIIKVHCLHSVNSEPIPISIRAKVISPAPVLLDSKYTSLVTSDNGQQTDPQPLNFGSCLAYLPNIRTFSIQNIHSGAITVRISIPASPLHIQMFVISSSLSAKVTAGILNSKPFLPPSSSAASSSNAVMKNAVWPSTLGYFDAVPEVLILNESSILSKSIVVPDRKARKEQDLEDLKWGAQIQQSIPLVERKKNTIHRVSTVAAIINESESLSTQPNSKQPMQSPRRQIGSSTSDDYFSMHVSPKLLAQTSIKRKVRGGTVVDDFMIREAAKLTAFEEGTIASDISTDERSEYSMYFLPDIITQDVSAGVFPFNLLNQLDSSDANIAEGAVSATSTPKHPPPEAIRKRKGSEDLKQKSFEQNIRRISNFYAKFSSALQSHEDSSSLKPIVFDTTVADDVTTVACASISLAADESVILAIVVDPKNYFSTSGEKSETNVVKNELNEIEFSHNLTLNVSSAGGSDADPTLLQSRAVSLNGIAICSEIVSIQRNISFGRTVLGDVTKQSLTLVNKSSIPAAFSISKSGKISSSFLTVPQGRIGVIAAFSSRNIDFIFKPSLAGSFVETLQINNVLNPTNSQTVTIKAKVSKMESFQLSPPVPSPKQIDHDENDNSNEKEIRNDFFEREAACQKVKDDYFAKLYATATNSAAPTDLVGSEPLVNAAVDTSLPSDNQLRADMSLPHVELSSVVVGEICPISVSFRIKNVTSKPRQFIIDATHTNAIRLLLSDYLAIESEQSSPFERNDDIHRSVLNLRCKFETSIVKSKKGNASGAPDVAALDEEKIKSYQDSLEAFQQKLKIAIRKNKAEKIHKYQKKINEVIKLLSGKNAHTDAETIPLASAETSTAPVPDVAVAPDTAVDNTKSVQEFNESDVTCHFDLNPDEERLVRVQVCFYPGAQYRHWVGPLPFVGYFRVFECKNEDYVKFVPFGASISLPMNSRLSLSSVPSFADSIPITRETSNRYYIITVPQWSCYPTRQIFQKYRQLPQEVLGVAVKLVQSSQERLMTGAFSIAYTHADEERSSPATDADSGSYVRITVDAFLDSNYSLDSTPYSESSHGVISFAVKTVEENSTSNTISAQQKKIDFVDSVIKCRITKKDKLDVVLQWKPPDDLSALPKQDVQIVGAIKVQYFSGQDSSATSTQYVPFVSILEHKSTFKLSRYFNFEQIAVVQYRTCQIPIVNSSQDTDLHYLLISEDTSMQSRTLGNIRIISGQTGVIPPNGSKSVHLHFQAYNNRGKFEQKFWVRNVKNGFDQKRIIVQASIVRAPEVIVDFPDLKLSSGSANQYAPIDMGCVQIQDLYTKVDLRAVKDYLRSENVNDDRIFAENVYHLRIESVYAAPLYVTAKSNLTSQCFIYCDKECTKLVDKFYIEMQSAATLYVILRPSFTHNTSSQTKSDDIDIEEEKAAETHTEARELVGGIRLVFYTAPSKDGRVVEDSGENKDGDTKFQKVLDTMLSFRATIGKSVLLLSGLPVLPMIQKSSIIDKSSQVFTYSGSFQIRNQSPVFPMRYCFLKSDFSDVSLLYEGSTQSATNLSPSVATAIISDSITNSLAPNEVRTINFKLTASSKSSLLILHEFQLLNIDTRGDRKIQIDLFFDRRNIVLLETDVPPLPISLPALQDLQLSPERYVEVGEVIECQKVIWLSPQDKVVPDTQYSNTNSSNPLSKSASSSFVCANEEVQFSFVIKNCDVKAVTVTPISNLPIIVTVQLSNPPGKHSLAAGGDISDGSSHLSTVRRGKSASFLGSAREKPTSVDKPIGKYRGKVLYKCGESFTVETNTSVSILVSSKAGLPLRDKILIEVLIRRGIQSGKISGFVGILAFLQAAHALQSIFEKPSTRMSPTVPASAVSKTAASLKLSALFTSPAASSGETSATAIAPASSADSSQFALEIPSLENLPVLSIAEIKCNFVLPDIHIKSPSINLNKYKQIIRRGDKVTFDIPLLENNCEVDIPLCIDNAPDWLTITVLGSMDYKPSNDDKKGFLAIRKADTVVRFVARIPIGIEDGQFEVKMKVKHQSRLPNMHSDPRKEIVFNGLSFAIVMVVDPKNSVELISESVCQTRDRSKFVVCLPETITTPGLVATTMRPISFKLKSHSDEIITAKVSSSVSSQCEDDVTILVAAKSLDSGRVHATTTLQSFSCDLKSFESQEEVMVTVATKFESYLSDLIPYQDALPSSLVVPTESTELCTLVELGSITIATTSQPAVPASGVEIGIENAVDPQYMIHVVVLGYVRAGPSMYITTGPESTVDATDLHLTAQLVNDNTYTSHPVFEPFAFPSLKFRETALTVCVINPTVEVLHFRIKTFSCRFPGFKIFSPSIDSGAIDEYVDTLRCACLPVEASVEPKSSLEVRINVVQGDVSESINVTSTEFSPLLRSSCDAQDLENVCLIPIHFYDMSKLDGSSPPTVVHVALDLKDINGGSLGMKPFKTQPVSSTNRSKQHLDHMLVEENLERSIRWDSKAFAINDGSTSSVAGSESTRELEPGTKLIRLRGATPIEGTTTYAVDLGQQYRRDDAIEWLVTLENCSPTMDIPFKLVVRPSGDEATTLPWLQLSQSRGIIPARDSVSVMIYVVRAVCGERQLSNEQLCVDTTLAICTLLCICIFTASKSIFELKNDIQSNALFAIPKKGRLYELCIKLLSGAGLEYHRPARLDVAKCTSLPITIVFLPASDIATYVGEGNVDIGITGLDVVKESQETDVEQILELGFGKCKLCLQAPVINGITSPEELAGKRIVTSFPNLAREFFANYDTADKPTSIKYVSGSVEAACGLGLADAVIDLVETGTTMRAAGLEIVSEVLSSQALLIASKTSKHPAIVELIRKRIVGYMTATNYMMIQYNILRRLLPEAVKITPGKRSPTISSLDADEDAVAVSALVLHKDSSNIMDKLEQIGATDILLFAINNSRM
eukprot:gene27611-36411_t